MACSVSVVIPAYNEEGRLPQTIERIACYLASRKLDFAEVIVVDDGSSDGTVAVAESFAATHPAIRVLRNPGNRGKGYSVRHGMLAARGEWLLFTDADLSTPIEELEPLWAAAEKQNADIAIGSRALNRTLIGVRQSLFRETAGKFFNFVMKLVVGLPMRDTQCGFKLFSQAAAQSAFSRQKLERFGFDVEVLFIAHLQGLRIVEVPVQWSDVAGTHVSVWNGAQSFIDLLTVRWNQLSGKYR